MATKLHETGRMKVLLAVFVGGINTLAGALLVGRHPRADAEAMVSGAVLATWIVVRALASPVVFACVSASYFRGPHAWAPLRAAATIALLVGLLDLVIVASFIQRSLVMFRSFVGSWLPLLLAFAATWTTGVLRGRLADAAPVT